MELRSAVSTKLKDDAQTGFLKLVEGQVWHEVRTANWNRSIDEVSIGIWMNVREELR